MVLVRFEFAGEARAALHAIVSDPAYGPAALSSPQTLENLLRDYLPDAPRETGLLVAAASAGVAGLLSDHRAHGLDVRTAVRLAASTLEQANAYLPEACEWVTTELAVALGLPGADQLGGSWSDGDQLAGTRPEPRAGDGKETVIPGQDAGRERQAGQPPGTALPATIAASESAPAPAVGPGWAAQVPAVPRPRSDERWTASPFPLADSVRYTVGWQYWPSAKGGPAFLTLRRNALGSLKIVERYPLTGEGWSAAWRALVSLDAASARQVLETLGRRAAADSTRAARRDLDARSRLRLHEVTLLAGYVPDGYLPTSRRYDVRVLEDRAAVYARNGVRALVELPFGDLAGVDVLDARPQAGAAGGFAAAQAGGELAGVLAAASRGKLKAVVRVRTARSELFFGASSDPDALRAKVSRALEPVLPTAVQPAPRQHPGAGAAAAPGIAAELARLASLVDKGMLTRDEYELLKARLLDSPS